NARSNLARSVIGRNGEAAMTVLLTTRIAEAEPAVRVRHAPPLEPPYDDERADGLTVCLGQLEIGGRPGGRAPLRATGAAGLPPGAAAPVSTEARAAAHRFVGVCVEVLNGFRPIGHLRALTTGPNYSAVT